PPEHSRPRQPRDLSTPPALWLFTSTGSARQPWPLGWLLQDPKMKLRTTYKGFTKAMNHYFDELIPKIVPLQYGKGGPIIAVQVENEYGSYHRDKRYMSYIKKALVTRGINVMLMTADDGKELKRGHLKHGYGALLTENGEYTSEYLVFQEFFTSSFGVPMPQRPDLIPKAIYKSLRTPYYIALWDVIPYLKEVFLNENYLGVLDHFTNQLTIHTKMDYKDIPTLRILVENQGRLAYGKDINKERKGLIGDIYLNNSPLRRFKIYSLDMKTKFLKRDLPNIWKPVSFKPRGPAFFLGILRMGNYPKDTFIKMEGWTKGVIFINGRNLGRYWNIGPQEALYLPGPWLHPGSNEIIVFEEFRPGQEIWFTNISHLGMVFWRVNLQHLRSSFWIFLAELEIKKAEFTISQEPELFLIAFA
ncbi:beta-galactosidase-1-like protein 2, partial [Panthera tigris]|uniref:beta-galactosidase-1-like protein 2 n=1 Tax=Panthera tigris TaxID=9694 RepID=UPI001C6FBF97